LVMKSTMPAARHSSRSDWRALAVMATMGTAGIRRACGSPGWR
jgi:hypothetical protein